MCWWLRFFAKRLTNEVAKAISGLVSTIENIIDPIIPWYLFISEDEASPSVRWLRKADSFIGVLTGLALSRWNFVKIFSMYAGWESLGVWLDSQLKFTPHINERMRRARAAEI